MVMKGMGSAVVIVVVAALLVLGGWYWSHSRGPIGTTEESTTTPATGSETATAGTSVTPTGNADIDASISSITKSADAYSEQANSEDGTEGAAQLNTSLNNQPAYVQ
jgi:hypothetical protein